MTPFMVFNYEAPEVPTDDILDGNVDLLASRPEIPQQLLDGW